MEIFSEYLSRIENPAYQARTKDVLEWVAGTFPLLVPRIAWNQPIFTDHGTYIIGFSVAKRHLAVAPERAGILRFSGDIARAGYGQSKELVRIPWDSPVNFSLLEQMIAFNISDKADCSSFWRKPPSE